MASYQVRRLMSQAARGRLGSLCNKTVQEKRCALYDAEVKRQQGLLGRVEKIEVHYSGVPEDMTLVMNKDQSTPYDCLRHVSEPLAKLSVLAEVDGEPWDMHRPLPASCTLRCRFFHDDQPFAVNKAFWRSCSLMLGGVLETAFRDHYYVQLHSFPSPSVRSGSFVYDAQLPFEDGWKAQGHHMRALAVLVRQLATRQLPFRRLVVHAPFARELFRDNEFKAGQVDAIAEKSGDGKVVLYRVGDFVDMSCGPAISHTGLLGRCSVTAAHRLETRDFGPLYRWQAVALPASIHLNHYIFCMMEESARELNEARIPALQLTEADEHQPAEAVSQ